MFDIFKKTSFKNIILSGGLFACLHIFQFFIISVPDLSWTEWVLGVKVRIQQVTISHEGTFILFFMFFLFWVLPLIAYKRAQKKIFIIISSLFLLLPVILDVLWAYVLIFGDMVDSDAINGTVIKHIAFGFLGYFVGIKYCSINHKYSADVWKKSLSLSKSLIFWFSILLLIFSVVMLLLQIDDDLDEKSHDLINRIKPNKESVAYLYLAGIYASEDEDPIKVGKFELDQQNKSMNDDSYEVVEYEDSKKIVLPDKDVLCQTFKEGCLEYLFSEEINAEDLLKKHNTLIARSNKFFEFKEYATLTKPEIAEWLPPYRYIRAAERLKIISAISTYKSGDLDHAVQALILQLNKVRNSATLQDNLIAKMVFLVIIRDVIDTLSVILTQSGEKIDAISNLNQNEKSFFLIVAREFVMSYNMFLDLDGNPNFFSTGNNVPSWFVRALFKPNMSSNLTAPFHLRLDQLTKLSPNEFAKEMDNKNSKSDLDLNFRNILGSVLANTWNPDYDSYVARVHDVDINISLFNYLHSTNNPVSSFNVGYYKNSVPEEKEDYLCVDGPFDDKQRYRCLRVRI